MTNEEILKKAIEKALANGYCPTDSGDPVVEHTHTFLGCWFYEKDGTGLHHEAYQIIFDHDFAKAFWSPGCLQFVCFYCGSSDAKGSCRFCVGGCIQVAYPKYQYHLQAMVLSPEPIKYLEQFLV